MLSFRQRTRRDAFAGLVGNPRRGAGSAKELEAKAESIFTGRADPPNASSTSFSNRTEAATHGRAELRTAGEYWKRLNEDITRPKKSIRRRPATAPPSAAPLRDRQPHAAESRSLEEMDKEATQRSLFGHRVPAVD